MGKLPLRLAGRFGLALAVLSRAGAEANEPDSLRRLREQGAALFVAMRYQEAGELFARGAAAAGQAGLIGSRGRFLVNLGGVQLQTFRYYAAREAFFEAQKIAARNSDPVLGDVVAANLAALYGRLGQWEEALAAADGINMQRFRGTARQQATWRLNRAIYLFRLSRFAASDTEFRAARDAAEALGDRHLSGQIWENWGKSFVIRSQFETAERCFLESFRLRWLSRDPELNRLYLHLAKLAHAMGNRNAAQGYADRALEAARQGLSNYPVWEVHHLRGRLAEERGDLEEALREYREAIGKARDWRPGILPVDQAVVSTEASLAVLYGSLLRAGWARYQRRADARLAEELLIVAEENRAAAFRNGLYTAEAWEKRFPAEYWPLLAELHRAEAVRDRAALVPLRARALAIETAVVPGGIGLAKGITLAALRSRLARDEALVCFHISAEASVGWAITREGVRFAALPPAAELSRSVAAFGRKGEAAIFSKIFGDFYPLLATKQVWSIVADGPVFELPLAAVRLPDGEPLGIKYAIHLLPSARALEPGPAMNGRQSLLVGVADPVYNGADPRLRGSLAGPGQLPRLPGTAQELRLAGAAWKGPVDLLSGSQVNRRTLVERMDKAPAVIHLATHVVPAPGQRALIALGFDSVSGRAEFLGAEEIAARRRELGLVVMSGCASGAGQPVPGAGLLGLTRAWILAGARGVVATYKPIPDGQGEMLAAFYRGLSQFPSETDRRRWAFALREAQREQYQQGADSSLWPAYYLMARN